MNNNKRKVFEEAKIRKRIEEWFKTDEGSEWKKEYEERLSRLRNEIKTERNDMLKKVRTIIINSLGQEWDVNMTNLQSMDIGIVGNHRENGNPSFHFECDFSLTWYQNPDYDEENFGKTFKLYICNFSTSEFEINKNNSKVKYITGVGKFLSEEKMIEQLTEVISKFDYKSKMLMKTISDLISFCKKSPSFRRGMNCKVIYYKDKKILFFKVFSVLVTIYI